jgi:hypothetical protein
MREVIESIFVVRVFLLLTLCTVLPLYTSGGV